MASLFVKPGSTHFLRPPGAVGEAEFVRRCIKCNQCAAVCPYDSIRMAHLPYGLKFGTPVIEARSIPCYLCMECPPVCPTGALRKDVTRKEAVRMGTAVIDPEKCLPYQGVICHACFERCPLFREAITLKEDLYPVVHEEICVGCGICENVCPAEEAAITVRGTRKL